MSKEYRTFEEAFSKYAEINDRCGIRVIRLDFLAGWNYRGADLSAILGEFEALAGKWMLAPTRTPSAELSALIQSVKEQM